MTTLNSSLPIATSTVWLFTFKPTCFITCHSIPGLGVVVLTLLAMVNVVLLLAILSYASSFPGNVFVNVFINQNSPVIVNSPALCSGPNCYSVNVAVRPESSGKSLPNVGTSQGFKDAGKLLSDAMDLKVNPCDDYYNYTCGGWMATAKYRYGRPSKNAMFDTGHDITKNMIELFSDPKPSGSEIIDHLKNAYSLCVNANNSKAMEALLEDIRESATSWPILDQSFKFSITQLIHVVHNTAVMKLSVEPDIRNTEGRH